ncbi:MAG TPA: hypothetical protein VFR09_02360 [Alphaproteobacteria bacterium]|nr:hypothetical protein [Alphaproteobacteria bacterium]
MLCDYETRRALKSLIDRCGQTKRSFADEFNIAPAVMTRLIGPSPEPIPDNDWQLVVSSLGKLVSKYGKLHNYHKYNAVRGLFDSIQEAEDLAPGADIRAIPKKAVSSIKFGASKKQKSDNAKLEFETLELWRRAMGFVLRRIRDHMETKDFITAAGCDKDFSIVKWEAMEKGDEAVSVESIHEAVRGTYRQLINIQSADKFGPPEPPLIYRKAYEIGKAMPKVA